jgi:putative transcriptional regulator
MNIDHHLSDELLLDYSSGAMVEGWSLAVSTHLALCPDCRQSVRDMEAIGGALMEGLSPVPLAEKSSQAVFAELSAAILPSNDLPLPQSGKSLSILPEPLRQYAGGDLSDVPWQRLGLGAYQYLIPTGDDETIVRLLRIPAGKPVPTHSHGGLELTLVLSGAFSDVTGFYRRGDIQEVDETLEHQPHAAVGEDCICLAVTDSPLRFSSFAARLVQPFIGI